MQKCSCIQSLRVEHNVSARDDRGADPAFCHAALRSAELPSRYWGDWGSPNASVHIRGRSYDTDTAMCQINRVIEGPRLNLEAYKVELTCRLVDESRPRKLQVVIGLRDISGKTTLIVASHYTNWPSIDIMMPQ
jgi:hypothetical protein